jgi:chemotaxis response regulator CheB
MYGMPKAVAQEHLADWVASPAEITARLSRLLNRSTVP